MEKSGIRCCSTFSTLVWNGTGRRKGKGRSVEEIKRVGRSQKGQGKAKKVRQGMESCREDTEGLKKVKSGLKVTQDIEGVFEDMGMLQKG